MNRPVITAGFPQYFLALLRSSIALAMSALALPSGKAKEDAVFVEVNGVSYEVPQSWTVEEATRVYNLEIPVVELKNVYMPLTQIEHLNGVAPKLFSEVAGCRLQLGMDVGGDVAWTVNPAGIELFSASSGTAFAKSDFKELRKRPSAKDDPAIVAKMIGKRPAAPFPIKSDKIVKKPAAHK